MAHTNQTANYNLPQFISSDKPAWLTDINGAFSAIDTAIHGVAQSGSDTAAGLASAQSDITAQGGQISNLTSSQAPQFNEAVSYSAGDYVIHNNRLYRASSAVAAGPWNSSNWTATTMTYEMNRLNSQVASQVAGKQDSILLGTVPTGTNLNNYNEFGIAVISGSNTYLNLPDDGLSSNYGFLENYTMPTGAILQRFTHGGGNIYSRCKFGGSWSSWRKITTTIL